TAGAQFVRVDGGGVGRRAPPSLELTRVGPQLPHPLGRGVELGGNGHLQRLRALPDCGDGHESVSLVWLMRLVMRSIRPCHSSSYRSSKLRATRIPSMLVRTTLRRPMRRLLTRPARSSTAMCFCTAAKLIS